MDVLVDCGRMCMWKRRCRRSCWMMDDVEESKTRDEGLSLRKLFQG